MKKEILQIKNSTDLFELCDHLKVFLEKYCNKSEFDEALINLCVETYSCPLEIVGEDDDLHSIDTLELEMPFLVSSGAEANLIFMSQVIATDGYIPNGDCYQEFMEYVHKNMKTPQGRLISSTEVEAVMRYIDTVIPLKKILKISPLEILLLNHSRNEYGSFNYATYRGKEIYNVVVMLHHDASAGLCSEYVFLHEMGHAFMFWMSGMPDKLPEGFLELLKEIKLYAAKKSMEEYIEIFADLFASTISYFYKQFVCEATINLSPNVAERLVQYYLEITNTYLRMKSSNS